MSITHAAALPAGFVLHEFRIERILGHGGFGITYLATDTLLRKAVAIKEYLPIDYARRGEAHAVLPRTDRDGEDFGWGLQRFLDEARTLARFRHPHLVPVLRFFEANGTGYMVMEFEDGAHAGEWFRSLGERLSEAQARALLLPLLDGLETVHRAGFLHRDIKPGNIVIKHDQQPVLIDFGAARQALSSRSRSVTAIVTPRYAPLEQYSSEGEQGPWSDIYALAAVIHTGLTGEPPPEATARVPKDRYRRLVDQFSDRYDPRFLAALDWALNVFPADRPQSVAEWRKALHQGAPAHAGDAPTMLAREADTAFVGLSGQERPVPQAAGGRRDRRSRRRLVALAVLVVIAAVGWSQRHLVSPPPADPQIPINTMGQEYPKPTPRPPANNQTNVPPNNQTSNPPRLPQIDAVAAQATAEAVQRAQARAEAAKAELERADQEAQKAREAAEKARARASEASAIVQSGVGLLELADGGKYAGEIQGGRRHGFGVTTYPSGDRLEGQWDGGLANGAGVYIWGDGRSYFGQWAKGAQQGSGVLQYPDGGRYAGQWANDQPAGLGQRSNPDGGQITGEWRAGKVDGFAVERYADGGRYEGKFADGRPYGRGVKTTADGKRQAGDWFNGALTRPD